MKGLTLKGRKVIIKKTIAVETQEKTPQKNSEYQKKNKRN